MMRLIFINGFYNMGSDFFQRTMLHVFVIYHCFSPHIFGIFLITVSSAT